MVGAPSLSYHKLLFWSDLLDSQNHKVSRIIGIDLGTTNSLVATVDSGIPLVIADANGNRLLPSVVHFDGDEVAVGQAANRVRVVKPEQTIYSVKRFMGRRGPDISEDEKNVHY